MSLRYRADTIGSLLRPAYLHEARQTWRAGQLSLPEFKRLEDRAVNEALALQEAAGLEVVTDGEMRHLLELSGYKVEALYGDFQRGPFRHGGEQVWVTRKA